uniref:Uncharacterized protein n=1 Tax=Rhizophora mucronata TaxID=61149 RepID=A0A2P2QMD8_RHIMU
MVWLADVAPKISGELCHQHQVQGPCNARVCVPCLPAFVKSGDRTSDEY